MRIDQRATRKIYVWRMYYDTEGGDRHSADSIRVTDDSPPIREGFEQNYVSPLDMLKSEFPNGHPVRVVPLVERWQETAKVKARSGLATYSRRVDRVRALGVLPDYERCETCRAPLVVDGVAYYDSDEVPATSGK